ncbi:DNA-directed primase/polymerase protein [Araneus ventricosus]|uniref:DNA-directed primase/polymerase protein n=1 Tax=Araneus ventricosus TaxID=182803 RepID=A0A4Y2PHB8_ARAVE|nr:DNA-directed primase/polymerase protein [Araneus ventricosus]
MSTTYIAEENPDALARKFYQPSSHPNAGGWSESILHLRKIYKEHKSKPIPVNLKSRLDGPSVSWEVFRRLNLAITYADSRTKDCMIFSFEERTPDNSGQRLFLVTHPQHLWLNYKSRPLETRCTYEVIREGVPCKLYFDLEFYKMYNSHKDGIKMTKIFIECVVISMFEDFNLKISASDFIWLDASTEKKYSCHLILQRNDFAFKNNVEAGDFVSSLICKIKRKIEGHNHIQFGWPPIDELKYMFVQDSDGRSVHFCDAGVYTKNRNFRVFQSTKYGKNAPLLLSPHNQYIPNTSAVYTDENEVIFYDSLVTFFRNVCNFTRLLSYDIDRTPEKIPNYTLSSRREIDISGTPQNSKSPYPEVDNFVLSLIKDDKTMGFIRKWSYLQTEDILVYEIGNYRFCHNIGRHHKSNNIMIVVDMKRKIYYQKCHDPECRAQCYKSTSQNLPENIISLYSMPDDFFESDCFSQLESDSNDEPNLTNKESIKNEDICADDFFLDDVSLDSYPFTQLQNSDLSCGESISKEADMNKTVNKNQNLEDSFLEDTTFDNLCMEDLDSECGKCTTENGNLNSQDVSDFFESTFSQDSVKDTTGEEMSVEDELIMAEAAAALEVSMNESVILEETIF